MARHKIHRIAEGLYRYRGEEVERNDGIPPSTYGRWKWNGKEYTYQWEAVEAIDRSKDK